MKPLLLALAVAFCVNAGAADPFASANFAPGIQPAAKPSESTVRSGAKPSAPPLPFRYIGRLVENGKTEVLLIWGERLYAIAAGDRIGDDYVVERIGDATISFTYLPLSMKQSLHVPGVN
jgi:hypothetical protein